MLIPLPKNGSGYHAGGIRLPTTLTHGTELNDSRDKKGG
jgi:hypothetical protein